MPTIAALLVPRDSTGGIASGEFPASVQTSFDGMFPHPKRNSTVVPELPEASFEMEGGASGASSNLDPQDCGGSSTSGRINIEKALPNGDFYSGSFEDGFLEGEGKYLWSDGCMYEGQWGRGNKTGKGKISWPSGATYEGDFMCGYMHGTGTYTGTDGTTYKGSWKMNLKHGLGRKRYANGDVYEGSWKEGVQEGPGRYVWENGNEYMGDWKGGVMFGRGVMNWVSGDSYDGHWLDGVAHGAGFFIWADGSKYVGTWSKGLKDGKGVYYPALEGDRRPSVDEQVATWTSRSRAHSLEFAHGTEQRRNSADITLERAIQVDKVERILEGEECFLGGLDGLVPSTLEREYVQGVLINETVKHVPVHTPRFGKRRHKRHVKEVKRPGETIIKGHRSYDLMLNLQLGIRYTVGKITPEPKHEIEASDFSRKAHFRMSFPRDGSQLTPSHHSIDFKWKDYCPMVFRHLRELFEIDAADYMLSICGNDALRELSSPGKSGSVFYLSHDDRFMIKTMRKSEIQVLVDMLSAYYEHVHAYENTLITKFFGLHRIKPHGGGKVRFVVMGNMFCTDLRIHRRFDLKGSSQGRSTDKVEIDENTTLKDLDLDLAFNLEPSWRETLMTQIEHDCKFLECQKIMDYSLLLGVHFRAPQYPAVFSPATCPRNKKYEPDDDWKTNRNLVLVAHGSDNAGSATPGSHVRGSPLRPAGNEEVDLLLGTARLRIQLGVNMPARADRRGPKKQDENTHSTPLAEVSDEVFDEVYDVVLYFGIIDILQRFDFTKRVEHAYKSLQYDAVSISAVEPSIYSQRFQEFIKKVFPAMQFAMNPIFF